MEDAVNTDCRWKQKMTRHEASLAVKSKNGRARAFKCPHCEWWHITGQRQRAIVTHGKKSPRFLRQSMEDME